MPASMITIKCANCGTKFLKAERTINKYAKIGRTDFYCSRACVNIGVTKKLLSKSRYYDERRKCPVCKGFFVVRSNSKKITCSHSCSNTYFRTGPKSIGNARYTTICFSFHRKKCVCCSEKLIVAVHHFDHDRSNNDPRNLVPLCPTHHTYLHSSHAHLVLPKVVAYVKAFRIKYKSMIAEKKKPNKLKVR